MYQKFFCFDFVFAESASRRKKELELSLLQQQLWEINWDRLKFVFDLDQWFQFSDSNLRFSVFSLEWSFGSSAFASHDSKEKLSILCIESRQWNAVQITGHCPPGSTFDNGSSITYQKCQSKGKNHPQFHLFFAQFCLIFAYFFFWFWACMNHTLYYLEWQLATLHKVFI